MDPFLFALARESRDSLACLPGGGGALSCDSRNQGGTGRRGAGHSLYGAVKLSKASLSPEDCEGFQAAYRSLGERRLELLEPWQVANADLVSAHEDAQRLLQEIG